MSETEIKHEDNYGKFDDRSAGAFGTGGFARYVGSGTKLGWDASGGTSYTDIGSIIELDSLGEAKWTTAKTAVLSEPADTFAKTSYDPGEIKITVVFDPAGTEYLALEAAFLTLNVPAASFLVTFPNSVGGGSGTVTKAFKGLVIGLSAAMKKNEFVEATITIKRSGAIT